MGVDQAMASLPPVRDQRKSAPAPAAEAMLKLRQLSQITQAFRQGTPASANPSGVQSRFQWGHLQAIELIGEGSFGRVYRAYDQLLDRDVALKLRRDSDSGLASTRAFNAEARRLARLRHPNLVGVHGAGVHDNCAFRATRSGCGIIAVNRPSGVVTAVSPSGEPFGLAG